MSPEDQHEVGQLVQGQNEWEQQAQEIAELQHEVAMLRRLEGEAWGIRYCCDGSDCGCMGKPIDPPSWWTPDVEGLRAENQRLSELNEHLRSNLDAMEIARKDRMSELQMQIAGVDWYEVAASWMRDQGLSNRMSIANLRDLSKRIRAKIIAEAITP